MAMKAKELQRKQHTIAEVVNFFEEKPKIEEEIRIGLDIKEKLKVKEDSFQVGRKEAQDILKTLNKTMETKKEKHSMTP